MGQITTSMLEDFIVKGFMTDLFKHQFKPQRKFCRQVFKKIPYSILEIFFIFDMTTGLTKESHSRFSPA